MASTRLPSDALFIASEAVSAPGTGTIPGKNTNREGLAGLPQSPQVLLRDHDVVHEVIMSLYAGDKSSLGCAYFSTRDSTLYLSQDLPMADLDMAEQLISHIEPTTLLVSIRTPKHLLDFLEGIADPGIGITPFSHTSPRVCEENSRLISHHPSAHDKMLNLPVSPSVR
jgi:hypothetical protein